MYFIVIYFCTRASASESWLSDGLATFTFSEIRIIYEIIGRPYSSFPLDPEYIHFFRCADISTIQK